MYQPSHFAMQDAGVIQALVRDYPLGAWVVAATDGLLANHIPWRLDHQRGEFGTLVGHVARANPVWQQLDVASESLVIFQGPQHYISPSWYASKREHGKVVPTWNYAVVHAYGIAKPIHDHAWLLALVTSLSQHHEQSRGLHWQVSDAPRDYIDRMLDAIVGIEIPVTRIDAKWKVSQNRPDKDRATVSQALGESTDSTARKMAEMVSGESA